MCNYQHKSSSQLQLFALGLFSVYLTACDGSPSESTTPPTPEPTTPIKKQLVIEGVITDAPIANASITVSIAGEKFTTTAYADGSLPFTNLFNREANRHQRNGRH